MRPQVDGAHEQVDVSARIGRRNAGASSTNGGGELRNRLHAAIFQL